jgi:hypothetical protein
MVHPYRTALLVFAAVTLLTGCSWLQAFRLTVTVVDKADGKPIPDATVAVDTFVTNEERKNDLPTLETTGPKTDQAGRLEYDFSISGYTPTHSGGDRWYLKVAKEGYEPVVTDFKPNPPPERSSDKDKPLPLTVKVEMRRIKTDRP